MKRGTPLFLLVCLLVFVALFIACAQGEEEKGTPTSIPEPTRYVPGEKAEYGGSLRISATSEAPHWDFQMTSSYVTMYDITFVFNKLLRFNIGPEYDMNDYTPAPCLAESWEWQGDKTLIFHLRKGVKWQNKAPLNGRELVAEDVKYTIERMMSKEVASPNAYMLEAVQSVECPDKYTVKVNLKGPFAPLITHFADDPMSILAKEAVDKWGDVKKPESAVGTGAFLMASYQPSVGRVFKRNPDYWEKDEDGNSLPYVNELRFLVIADTSTALAGLRSGSIDLNVGVTRSEIPSLQQSNPELILYEYTPPLLGTAFVAMRVDQPPFNDIRVRQAISMAVDRKMWVDTILYGRGEQDNGPIPWSLKEWKLEGPALGEGYKYRQYNLQEAKRLLAEAGYPTGFKTSLNSTPGYGTTHLENTELFKDILSKIGIDAKIELKDYGSYMASTFVGKYDGMVYGLQTAFMEVDGWLWGPYYSTSPRNIGHVNDPKLDEMIDKQRATLDKTERKKIIDDIQKYLAVQCYYVNQPGGYGVGAWHPWVRHYGQKVGCTDYGSRFTRVWVDQRSPTRK